MIFLITVGYFCLFKSILLFFIPKRQTAYLSKKAYNEDDLCRLRTDCFSMLFQHPDNHWHK